MILPCTIPLKALAMLTTNGCQLHSKDAQIWNIRALVARPENINQGGKWNTGAIVNKGMVLIIPQKNTLSNGPLKEGMKIPIFIPGLIRPGNPMLEFI